MNQINNDNICHGSKNVPNDDNIHSFSCVAKEKVKNNFLYMGYTLWCDGYNNILKRIMGYNVLTPT